MIGGFAAKLWGRLVHQFRRGPGSQLHLFQDFNDLNGVLRGVESFHQLRDGQMAMNRPGLGEPFEVEL